MQIDWNIITAITALIAALVAIIALLIQIRLSRITTQIELVRHFDETYRRDEFIKIRARAAKILLMSQQIGTRDTAMDQLLGFFEFLGLLRRQKAISDFLLWHLFSTHMFYYVAAAKDYIYMLHSENVSVYQELIHLHEALTQVEKKEAGAASPDLNLSPERIKAFLEKEIIIYEESL